MSILQELCDVADSFFARGYAFGSTGNLSVRIGSEIWITPTGKALRGLRPDTLACMDENGSSKNDNKPSKEYPFHLACYRERPEMNALVHLHSTHSVALSCLEDLNPEQPMPLLTPYFLMRVAPLAIVPYFRPGSQELADAVGRAAPGANSLLLRNHGLICLGKTLNEAVDRTEELEETARLFFLLRNEKVRVLNAAEQDDIRRVFLR